MKTFKTALFLLSLSCAFLAGCSGTKETLGLNKKAPDEFQVVKRAPLSLPPDYTLRPPRPGAPRPQELEPTMQAQQAVFGEQATASQAVQPTNGEQLLLQQAGAQAANPEIRAIVDQETTTLHDRNKPTAEKLFGIGGDPETPSATVVDAKAEIIRIETNKAEGKPITEGDTPYIEE